ncbi:MAG TPA: hypothetical protein VF950_19620 [Planctomycetota bacterium]
MGPRFRVPGELPVPPREGEAPPSDSPLAVQLVLSRATELARAGHYEQAARLLADLRLSPRQAPPVFHLGALIHAQLGQLEEAAALWKRVLEIEPGHAGASAGLRQVQRTRARPFWLSTLLAWPVAGALLLGALVLVFTRPPSGLEALAAEQKRLAADVERLLAKLDVPPAPPELDPGDLPVLLETRGDERLLRFKDPLFDAGSDVLRPDARALLARLAERLAGKADCVVVGYAVEPVAEAGVQARRRAAAVADLLRAGAQDRPGSDAPAPGEAIALRLSRVKK